VGGKGRGEGERPFGLHRFLNSGCSPEKREGDGKKKKKGKGEERGRRGGRDRVLHHGCRS